jgi:hypothetical protein
LSGAVDVTTIVAIIVTASAFAFVGAVVLGVL